MKPLCAGNPQNIRNKVRQWQMLDFTCPHDELLVLIGEAVNFFRISE